ncbi:MAG: cytochrome C [Gammaproteobacteria bacterium]|nr:cytochrome C [Gammaproteobacteria bacterium]
MRIKKIGLTAVVAGVLLSSTVLASGPRSAGMLANTCAGCHGTNGASAGDAMPIVGGYDKRYLEAVLTQFKTGERDSTIMGRIMRGYSDLEIKAISTHMASQKWVSSSEKTSKVGMDDAAKIHKDKCETCHENNGVTQDDEVPRIAGQWSAYTKNMLYLYHDIGSPASQPRKMRKRVQKLSQDELDALANFYASQKK